MPGATQTILFSSAIDPFLSSFYFERAYYSISFFSFPAIRMEDRAATISIVFEQLKRIFSPGMVSNR